MAADRERAGRIKALKADHPELTWRGIADHVGVDPRSAAQWGATGQISYDNAKKLAELFPEVTLDYIWRGSKSPCETPDLMAGMNGDGPAIRELLETVLADLEKIKKHLGLDETTRPTKKKPDLPRRPLPRRQPRK